RGGGSNGRLVSGRRREGGMTWSYDNLAIPACLEGQRRDVTMGDKRGNGKGGGGRKGSHGRVRPSVASATSCGQGSLVGGRLDHRPCRAKHRVDGLLLRDDLLAVGAIP